METIKSQVSDRSRILDGVKNIYTATAIVVLTAIVLLAMINVLLLGVFSIKDSAAAHQRPQPPRHDGKLFNADGSPADNGKRSDYELMWFDYKSYENISEQYAGEVLDDFYDLSRLGFIYQPWVQFSEPPFEGKRVHVDRDIRGFPVRRTINPANHSNAPVVNVFVFGGSTTFGYHVSDEHTWTSYLSQILNETSGVNVQVTNYGHGYFNPSQEAVLFADLLKSGHRPSLALFMDGVNPPGTIDVPHFTEQIAEGYRKLQFPPSYFEQFSWIPMVRLSNFLERRLLSKVVTADTAPEMDIDTHIKFAVNGFRQSRNITKAVATLYDVPTLFFLQPNALYEYDTDLIRNRSLEGGDDRLFWKRIYEQLRADDEYIDLSGLLTSWGHRKAFVDDSHYSPSFNQFLAQHVAEFIRVGNLRPRDMEQPTGGVRTQ